MKTFKKKKTTKLEDFKFWLFLRNCNFLIWLHKIKSKILKFNHCRKGFHFFERGYIHVSIGGAGYTKGWSRKSVFFECKVCGAMYFPTKKDMNNWMFLQKRNSVIYFHTNSSDNEVRSVLSLLERESVSKDFFFSLCHSL